MIVEVENYIKENYNLKKYKEMVADLEEYGVTQDQIRYFLKQNGLKKQVGNFSKEDDDFIISNYQSMTYENIGKHLGFSMQQIISHANYLGLSKYDKKYNGYFKEINTANKAYYLGYIYADGYVEYMPEKYYYRFGIKLQLQDAYILEFLNNELNNQYTLRNEEPYDIKICNIDSHSSGNTNLVIHSKDLVLDLINLNILPNKTYKLDIPYIPDEFFFDWLRGYIDGDGCFSRADKKNKRLQLSITGTNYKLFEYLRDQLRKYNIATRIYHKSASQKTSVYTLYVSAHEDIQALINKLYYKDCLCLRRKLDKVNTYCKNNNLPKVA